MDIKFANNLLELLLPRRCFVCGRELLQQERFLCTSCAMNIPLTYFWTENHNAMADKLNGRVQAIRDRCGITEYEPYIQAAALFFYRGDYKGLTRELKYNAELPLGRYMAGILGRKLSGSGYFGDVDVVIPVPLHWWRRYRRGYNQAEVIAREVAAALGATVDTATLRRRRHTKSQARLDVGSKAGNVAGAFEVSAIPEWCRSSDGCERKVHHILLIDDVFTTGSTLAECCFALRRGLPPDIPVRISVATLAFVGE